MLRLLLAALILLPITANAAPWWGKTYSEVRHPLLGTAFCLSGSKTTCKKRPFVTTVNFVEREKGYGFERAWAAYMVSKATGIKFNWNVRDDGITPAINFYVDSTRGQTQTDMDKIASAERFEIYEHYTHGHRTCDIIARNGYMDRYTGKQKVAVYIHEIGHCLGLDHYPIKSGQQEMMYSKLQCDAGSYYSTCGVTQKYSQAINEGYFYEPYGALWWNDDTSWVRWVDSKNGGTYRGQQICGILGLSCIYM